MSTPVTVHLPHQLGRAEAHRRIETGLSKIVQSLPGSSGRCDQRWEANAGSGRDHDRLVFSMVAMGQTISGVIDVFDTVVKMEIDLPGVLGLLAGSLTARLKKTGALLLTKKPPPGP